MAIVEAVHRVPVARISDEARQVRFWRTVLTVLAGVLWLVGWSLSKVWLAVAWCCVAVKVGWNDARAEKATGDS